MGGGAEVNGGDWGIGNLDGRKGSAVSTAWHSRVVNRGLNLGTGSMSRRCWGGVDLTRVGGGGVDTGGSSLSCCQLQQVLLSCCKGGLDFLLHQFAIFGVGGGGQLLPQSLSIVD